MAPQHYTLVALDAAEADEKEYSRSKSSLTSATRWKAILVVLGLFLVASLSTNALLLYQRFYQPWALYNELPTRYAGLRRDVPRDVMAPENYSSLNRTIQDAAWNDPKMVSWDLFVALDEDWTIAHGLPHSQRWPWDTSKGVYITTAAHELHCVHVLRSFVNEKEDGVPDANLTWNYEHTIHCLNVLRETVMCNADDQPMYTGRLHDNVHFEKVVTGRGTTRMCRNWDTLVDWAHANSACYTSINRGDPNFREIDRYKHCPDKSRPWENRML